MKKNITLPNNGFGVAIMLLILLMIIIVPVVVTFWLASSVAPWWVAVPVSAGASIATVVSTCTFGNK